MKIIRGTNVRRTRNRVLFGLLIALVIISVLCGVSLYTLDNLDDTVNKKFKPDVQQSLINQLQADLVSALERLHGPRR